MSSSPVTFTPSNTIDMDKERDWPANLGMLDWDSTSVVFTKRSLLEFLKYAGITVDPNFTNIQKLPRYATFGKLSGDASAAPDASSAGTEAAATAAAPAQEVPPVSDFKPTRRVRDPPGGRQHNIFDDVVEEDALSGAPPKAGDVAADAPRNRRTTSVAGLWDAPDNTSNNSGFKPTRRVREIPGGKDSISGLFG
ncbi:uncharacterized protein TRAVEDRAFT_146360 [Trametes versicolor FP-101664 SS1]|uniref:uncharacterized protein n=1 Tax=Trametes versicolor (strain FP-101664) TaxID=717944 RepID=UPI00046246D7|nr:uncharacterized protein TRAVEDRAFT_146360 [Trametes versicolor FP-101664 SS1]EIW60726.1 hypothetical protein TRAVEDRAFT_146360 [Trametes versicolor FP-101664 SS1]